MMRTISTIFLIGIAALSSACADENDKSKAAVSVTQNAAAATKEETITIARNTGGASDDITVAKNTTGAARETGTTRMAVDLMATPYHNARKAG